MVFLWFSHCPMVFLWFSYGFSYEKWWFSTVLVSSGDAQNVMLCLGAAIGLSLESHCRMKNDHHCVPIKASLDSQIIYIYIYIHNYIQYMYVYIYIHVYIYIYIYIYIHIYIYLKCPWFFLPQQYSLNQAPDNEKGKMTCHGISGGKTDLTCPGIWGWHPFVDGRKWPQKIAKYPGELIAIGDLILPGLLGIMITHSREAYQPTSIMSVCLKMWVNP